jgi:hypothetical protein
VTDDATPAPPRYLIVRGGIPGPEELAAVAVALTPVAVAGFEHGPHHANGWALAALHEGVGQSFFVAASDLAALG